MVEEFQIGSIAELVDRTGSKIEATNKQTKRNLKRKKENTSESVGVKKRKFPKIQNFDVKIDELKFERNKKKLIKSGNLKKKKLSKSKEIDNENIQDDIKKHDDDQKKTENISNTGKQLRTLFIGNLPANFHIKNLKKILQQYGKVMSIRIRCVAPAKITLSKKVAYLSNQVNPNKKSVNVYAVFKEKESVHKALELNGQTFEDNVIQVDTLENDRVYDHSLSLFLGNLSFKINEDKLREFFKDCGEIKSLRIVRDNKTGMGKGFGYVNFKSKDSVVLALEKNGQLLNNREIRIKPYKYNPEIKEKPKKEGNNLINIKRKTTKSQNNRKSNFQGEKAVKKKLMKKKSKKIKTNRIKKQKKQTLGEILAIK